MKIKKIMMNIKKLFNSKKILIIVTAVLVILFVLISLFTPVVAGQYIKRFGVKLSPNDEIEPITNVVYLQNDDRWKDEHLGETNYTLGSQGCLICVIAMDLCYFGYNVIPTDVNNAFTENDTYTKNGKLIWYKINLAYKDIEYAYEKTFNSKTIMNDLHDGRLPIVKVRYKKMGIFHWVLIVGADENGFLILDPLNSNMEPIPLSEHGRVYAYRVLKEKEKS